MVPDIISDVVEALCARREIGSLTGSSRNCASAESHSRLR